MSYTQNETEKRKVEQYFSRKKINPEAIQSFCFMQNYKFRVGPSILILQLRSGKTKMLRPNKKGTEVLHYLLDKQIPFSNYTPQAKQAVTVPEKSYWSIWNIIRRFLYSSVACLRICNAESLITRAYRRILGKRYRQVFRSDYLCDMLSYSPLLSSL